MLDPARRRDDARNDNRNPSLPDSVGGYISAVVRKSVFGSGEWRVEWLLAIGVYGRGHAAENLPRAVTPDPGVRDPHCVCSHYLAGVASGPVRFDSIMIDRDVAGYANGQLLN